MAVSKSLSASDSLAQQVAKYHVKPLWMVLGELITEEPTVPEVPFIWRWKDLRDPLYEATRIISAEDAERRVLTMENPAHRNTAAVTHYLNAGLQIIMPGEIAPTHRHTANAIRFILEGNGAYTVVDGEKTLMRRGDFLTTPIWSWHDHGNESDGPMVWLDGLDFPFVNTSNAMFRGEFPPDAEGHRKQKVTKPLDDSLVRYAQGLRPVGNVPETARLYSPIVTYRYTVARDALLTLARTDSPDPHDAFRMEYVNPVTGGPVLPTIDAFMQLLPKGFSGRPHRHTHGTIYAVVEGSGRTTVGETVLEWEPNDVFVAPSWLPHRHEASEDAFIFSFTDAPIQRPFGIHREESC